jgi:two-component system, NarL family, nitrate/nitrite response regulator NarL
MTTVLLVDDHEYIRQGLSSLLEAAPDIQVVATAANGIEGVAKARSHQPDIVVIDISMPLMNGIEATGQILAGCPQTRVLAVSIYPHKEYIEAALQAGASGYVLKDKIADELVEAIRTLSSGRRYFSDKIASAIDA